jgi:hypothetical protein
MRVAAACRQKPASALLGYKTGLEDASAIRLMIRRKLTGGLISRLHSRDAVCCSSQLLSLFYVGDAQRSLPVRKLLKSPEKRLFFALGIPVIQVRVLDSYLVANTSPVGPGLLRTCKLQGSSRPLKSDPCRQTAHQLSAQPNDPAVFLLVLRQKNMLNLSNLSSHTHFIL